MVLKSDSPLIQNLFLKRDLLRDGDRAHEKIRPVLLILGGGMRGVCGTGSAHALQLLGLNDVFETVVGISTGAGIAAYFLCGLERGLLGASVYYEDLPPRFIKYFRRPIVDVDFVEQLLRDGRKKLEIETICNARSKFFVGVTDFHDGSLVFLNVKETKPDPITAIKASMAIPGLYHKAVEVNGSFYVDGGIHPFPAKTVVEMFAPTDILVIANCSQEQGNDLTPVFAEKVFSSFFLRGVSQTLRKLWTSRYKRWHDGLDFFTTCRGVNTGILWASQNIGLLTRNSQKLRGAAENSVAETLKVFGEPHRTFQLL